MPQFDMEELKTFMRNLIRYEDACLDAMETLDDSKVPPNPAADKSAHMDRMIKYLADFGMLNANCYMLIGENKIMRSGPPRPTAKGRDFAFGGGITADQNAVHVTFDPDDLRQILNTLVQKSDLKEAEKQSLLSHASSFPSQAIGTALQELVKQMVDHSTAHMPSLVELLRLLLRR